MEFTSVTVTVTQYQARTGRGIHGRRRGPQAARPAGGPPPNSRKAIWGAVRPQGVEGSGMAGRGETLGGVRGYPFPYGSTQYDDV
jgi:hypothetical protein